jgi:hypothetical protein
MAPATRGWRLIADALTGPVTVPVLVTSLTPGAGPDAGRPAARPRAARIIRGGYWDFDRHILLRFQPQRLYLGAARSELRTRSNSAKGDWVVRKLPHVFGPTHRRWVIALTSAAGSAALAVAVIPAASAATAARTSGLPEAIHVTHVTAVRKVGAFNLRALAAADAKKHAASTTTARREMPLRALPSAKTASHASSVKAPVFAGSDLTRITTRNVRGERGFDGLTSVINAGTNPAIGDVAPPDQGLAVGPSPSGTVLMEFLNQSLNVYSSSGATLAGAIPAYQLFGLAPSAFLSDPRAYWDPTSHHWFLTMFTFGAAAGDNQQYIALSDTTDPFGFYTVYDIPTSDPSATGCPCFGDFDQVGSDANGFYIATNEFSYATPAFNGAYIYAVSKINLIKNAEGAGPMPDVFLYKVPVSDPFGSYHVSPSTVTQGASAPDTEYFVESNGNLPYDGTTFGSGLEVFNLHHTELLNSNTAPPTSFTTVNTKPYSQPLNVTQKTGPNPLGASVGEPVAQLQTDFNAVQEVTYAGGRLYAELNTGFNHGNNSGAAWFVLKPSNPSGSFSVKLLSNGYVLTSQNILYPVIGVNAGGNGYLAMAVAGPNRFPSAAYVKFKGTKGTVGDVHIAANGTAPEDDFTCYPEIIGSSPCRYGDYSMAQAFNGRIYQATEYVAPQPRDIFSNWGTRIWSVPTP